MTNVADRHWGLSLVRAPTAKDAANPGSPPAGAASPLPPAPRPPTRDEGQSTLLGRAATVLGRPGAREPGHGPTLSPAPPTPSTAHVTPAARLPVATDDDRATAPMRRVPPSASPVAPAVPNAVAVREPNVAHTAIEPLRAADPTPAPTIGPAPAAGPSATNGATRAADPSATNATNATNGVTRAADPSGTNGTRVSADPSATNGARAAATSAPAHQAPTIDPPAANPSPMNGPSAASDSAADPSLARLARGTQDCARALSCLGDRLDRLERRLDAADASRSASAGRGEPGGSPAPGRPAPVGPESLEAMVRALEGMSADRLQGLDQRLRRLETLPASVGRLQKDTAWLADLATTRRLEARSASIADLAPVHQEIESVADMVRSQHTAATQSLDRVRTLERVVLDMRRQLERDLAEHTRVADSGQAIAGSRIEGVEARLAAVESCLSPTA